MPSRLNAEPTINPSACGHNDATFAADVDAEIAAIDVRTKSLQDLLNTLDDEQMASVSPAKERDADALQERRANLLTERDALFDFIRDEKIEGVILISGDTHFGEVNCIPRSEQGGYDLYDFVSSPLAQLTGNSFLTQEPEIRIRPPYFRSVNFGLLDFEWEPEPKVTFSLRDVRGDAAYAPVSLTLADLRNGASTWRSRIDAKELERREARLKPERDPNR